MKKIFTILMAMCFFATVSAQINDGAESYTNFTVNPTGIWTWVDVDQSTTYGMTGTAWENAYGVMAAIVFNPSATEPALATVEAHGGSKMFAFFASTTSANNDWMISPTLTSAGTFSFWAKSFTTEYGAERFKVLTSTTNNATTSFTKISEGTYVEAPEDWTQYTYAIPAGVKHVAINCVSNDAFIFLVDDVSFTGTVAVEETAVETAVYPNPASISVTFTAQENINKVEIFNLVGQLVYSNVAGNNTVEVSVNNLSDGVYVAKIHTATGVSNQKFNVVK